MPTATCNGQRLYYEVHGEGPPLLCVMGLGADLSGWALQVPAFARAHRVVVFDNRDAGRSSRAAEPYTTADMARDALALLDALELADCHVLGLSLGGAVAQELALAEPARVRTLTLAATFAARGARAAAHARLWERRVREGTREDDVDERLLLLLSDESFARPGAVAMLRQAMLASPWPQEPGAFARQLAASVAHDARERLGALAMPVHVIGAERDLLVPVWHARELAGLIPGARLTVIEGAAHGLNLERAPQLNEAVLAFLAEAEPATAG